MALRPKVKLSDALHCPTCGHRINGASAIMSTSGTAIRPKKGDVSVCLYCTAELIYGPRGASVALLSDAERDGLRDEQPELVEALARAKRTAALARRSWQN